LVRGSSFSREKRFRNHFHPISVACLTAPNNNHTLDVSFWKKLFGRGSVPDKKPAEVAEREEQIFCKDLTEAASLGRLEQARRLLRAGADKNARDADGCTALHLAASSGDLSMAESLLTAGVDREAKDKNGRTALHRAVERNSVSVIKYLLSAGVNKDAKDKDGLTPLYYAASRDRFGLVEVLLAAGADKGVTDNNGRTAFDMMPETSVSMRQMLRVPPSQPNADGGVDRFDDDEFKRLKELNYKSEYATDWLFFRRGNCRVFQVRAQAHIAPFLPPKPSVPSPIKATPGEPSHSPDIDSDARELASRNPTVKGKPNPTSSQVVRFGKRGDSSGIRFLCPTCSTPNTAYDSQIFDVVGANCKCSCGNISHIPAAYKTQTDISSLAVHGGVCVPIADLETWMLSHPSFRTPDGRLQPDTEFHGSYGLWGFCAGCHYQYASTILSMFPMFGSFKSTIVNVNSEKSRQDVDALSKKGCPRCGNSNLIAIMIGVPKDVRAAIEIERRKRGL
jgi:hypothetical protein